MRRQKSFRSIPTLPLASISYSENDMSSDVDAESLAAADASDARFAELGYAFFRFARFVLGSFSNNNTTSKELIEAPVAREQGYRNLDAMLQHPSGGTLFTGNIVAAESEKTLREHNIGLVVNCQGVTSPNKFEETGICAYARLPVATWRHATAGQSLRGVLAFFQVCCCVF